MQFTVCHSKFPVCFVLFVACWMLELALNQWSQAFLASAVQILQKQWCDYCMNTSYAGRNAWYQWGKNWLVDCGTTQGSWLFVLNVETRSYCLPDLSMCLPPHSHAKVFRPTHCPFFNHSLWQKTKDERLSEKGIKRPWQCPKCVLAECRFQWLVRPCLQKRAAEAFVELGKKTWSTVHPQCTMPACTYSMVRVLQSADSTGDAMTTPEQFTLDFEAKAILKAGESEQIYGLATLPNKRHSHGQSGEWQFSITLLWL